MMNGLYLPFVILPCAGAILATWMLRDWRLSAAATCGSLGVVILAASVPTPFLGVLLPVLSGVFVGSAVTTGMLLWAPTGSVWGRMTIALLVTFVIFLTYLSYALQEVA